jgi:ABC-type dipeptide/oligopeptide/nickel transport system permease component
MLRAVPGDPVTVMLSEHASPEEGAQLRHQLGLDRPVYIQYFRYMDRVVHGDLGRSIRLALPVTSLIRERFPATLELAFASLALASLLGVIAGVAAAAYRGRLPDHAIMVGALLGVSLPSFWLALMLILFFGLKLGVLPIAGNDQGLKSLVLPAITLATIPLAVISRLTRSSLVEVLREDYIRTAFAKGLSRRRVLIRHALRNGLIPLITVVGIQFGTLLGGAIIVETVFAWPGIGRLLIDAVAARDFPLIQGIILFIAAGFVLVNLAVDLLYAWVDPRVRHQFSPGR